MAFGYPNYGGYQPPYYPAPVPNPADMMRQQQQPAPTPQNGNGLIWVQGMAGAKSYILAPNQTAMLMDSEAAVFYIKSADASGMPLPLRVFDYSERTGDAPGIPAGPEQGNPVTREEFEDLRAKVDGLMAPKKQTKKEEPKHE